MLLEGFERLRVTAGGATIHLVRAGSGPPVLLLHGYPQTHVMWHRVAPRLATRFTVVAADLRGYGDSSKPPGGGNHDAYSKRTMAQDQVEVMRHLGFEKFAVVGHDRGARVAYRMALDHVDRVSRLAVLDIIPTSSAFGAFTKELAIENYHWFFLVQPAPLPEHLIAGDPEAFMTSILERFSGSGLGVFTPAALAEYARCFRDPAAIHAGCEDYRAGASLDILHDQADFGNRRIGCPVLALWGAGRPGPQRPDFLATWREWADDVRGRALACGHFVAEEAPDETASELECFLT